MKFETPTAGTVDRESDAHDVARPRDADNTRQRLLEAARLRFARDGYAATTVRDIATDAGVNVALINRYFTSKEGLFEACLERAVKELDEQDNDTSTIDQILQVLIAQVTNSPGDEHPLQMLLLLRSSGDEAADGIRRKTLRGFSERMAAAAGWTTEDETSDRLVLRAQLVLATAFGMLLLRSSTALEPLTSSTEAELQEPLGLVLNALLTEPGK